MNKKNSGKKVWVIPFPEDICFFKKIETKNFIIINLKFRKKALKKITKNEFEKLYMEFINDWE